MSNRRIAPHPSAEDRDTPYTGTYGRTETENQAAGRRSDIQKKALASRRAGASVRPDSTLGSLSQASGEESWQISGYNPSQESSGPDSPYQGPYPLAQPLPQGPISDPRGQGESTFHGYGDPQHHPQQQVMAPPQQHGTGFGQGLYPPGLFPPGLLPRGIIPRGILPITDELFAPRTPNAPSIPRPPSNMTPEEQRAELDRLKNRYDYYREQPRPNMTQEEQQAELDRINARYRSYLQGTPRR